jgi:hypothetical protein
MKKNTHASVTIARPNQPSFARSAFLRKGPEESFITSWSCSSRNVTVGPIGVMTSSSPPFTPMCFTSATSCGKTCWPMRCAPSPEITAPPPGTIASACAPGGSSFRTKGAIAKGCALPSCARSVTPRYTAAPACVVIVRKALDPAAARAFSSADLP